MIGDESEGGDCDEVSKRDYFQLVPLLVVVSMDSKCETCSGSKYSGRPNRPLTGDMGRRDNSNLSRYRQRHLNDRCQPLTDMNDVEPDSDSDSDIIPPTPTDCR